MHGKRRVGGVGASRGLCSAPGGEVADIDRPSGGFND